MRIATPAFFCFPFAWNIFSHPLTFSLYMSLGLKWVSCRQQIYGSWFYIHSVSLYLLVGVFSLLIFKVIIDIFLLAFSWLFWVCFCRSFLSLVFTGYESPFSICCKAGLVMLNSLNFCMPVKLLISPSILNVIFAEYSNLGCRFLSFSTLNIFCRSLLACRVSAESFALNCMIFSLVCDMLLFPRYF